jgi:hypothetical protein
MYERTYWQDEVRSPDRRVTMTQNSDGTYTVAKAGVLMQQGTNQDEVHFNNLEAGISDATIASALLDFALLQYRREEREHASAIDNHAALVDSEILGETQTVTLSNTAKYPFNSTVDAPVSVALNAIRKNLYYTVEATVTSYTGFGDIGEILITDKALNGFKVGFSGSAASATLTLRIKGGMT